MASTKRPKIWVSEAEERRLKGPVQDIFYGFMDRSRAATGTVDREASVAFCARGLGQALKAVCSESGLDLAVEAPRWEAALFEHLAEVKVKVTRAKVKPTKGTCGFVAELVTAFRAEEEWFFPSVPEVRLEAWLVACFRVIERVVPPVKAERAAGLFLEHFDEGLRQPALVSRPRASKKRLTKRPRPRRRAR